MTETTRRNTSKPGSVGGWFRRRWLIEQVLRHGGITTTNAARALGVSEMTVRRDMTWLADHHGYYRVHGGLLGPQPLGPGQAPRASPSAPAGQGRKRSP